MNTDFSCVSVEFGGVVYPSVSAAAKAFGISPQLCSARLIRGIPLDRPVCSGRAKACEYNGRRYASISDFARAEKLSLKKARTLIELSGKWIKEGK